MFHSATLVPQIYASAKDCTLHCTVFFVTGLDISLIRAYVSAINSYHTQTAPFTVLFYASGMDLHWLLDTALVTVLSTTMPSAAPSSVVSTWWWW